MNTNPNQLDVFQHQPPADPFGTEPRKLYRTDSPDTSVAAAHSTDSAKLERAVFLQIAATGRAGCISDEVRGHFPGLPYSSVTARYSALFRKGLIVDTGERRPGRSGRAQRVMRAKVAP